MPGSLIGAVDCKNAMTVGLRNVCSHTKQAPAVAKSSSFTPALRAAEPVVGATGRAALRMPKVTMMAEAKKSVKDLGAAALKGKKVKQTFGSMHVFNIDQQTYFHLHFNLCRGYDLMMIGAQLQFYQVLIRCDLNVPLDGKTITDDTRE